MTQLYQNLENSRILFYSARATELYTQTFRLLHAEATEVWARSIERLRLSYRRSEPEVDNFWLRASYNFKL